MDKTYTIAVGGSRTETRWHNQNVTWAQLLRKLSAPVRTPETVEDYARMPKDQRGRLKDIGGFVGGCLGEFGEGGKIVEGRRNAGSVRTRSLLTLDIDYANADSIGIIRDTLAGYNWALYSTHSHTTASPRYRLVIPLATPVTADQYIPIARKVAEDVGIDTFDDSTYEPHRLMYWPSVSRDGEYVLEQGSGEDLNGGKLLLERYRNWEDPAEWPVSSRIRAALRKHSAKMEDPTQKTGIIGAFCRAYSITEAMDAFLPGTYEKAHGENRYTYTKGSTACGAIVYEDKWLYSHHGSDPCGEREVNAFDMVRLHRFGSLDADAAPDTPVNRLPSFQAMTDLVMADEKAAGQMAVDKYNEVQNDFGDLAPAEDWVKKLKTDKKGNYLVSIQNFYTIFRHDPKILKGDVRRDAMRQKDRVFGQLPWDRNNASAYWTESDTNNLLVYLGADPYNLNGGKQMILDAWDAAMSHRTFHPVRDYLNGLPAWDGVPRLDTLLHDYLGARDTELTRAMTRKQFTAAVARVLQPGVKYDYILTFVGPEGIGKSTLIRTLAGNGKWFSDSFTTSMIGDKEAMDQLRSAWIFEMSELKDYKRNTVEAFKSFISKCDDIYRAAYARTTEVRPRQCVFFASTNEKFFLKGDTGNRRFWAVQTGVEKPAKDPFNLHRDQGTIDQIWAEALKRFRDGEQLFLSPELEALARADQERFNEIAGDDRTGMIEAFLRRRLPANWWDLNRDQRCAVMTGGQFEMEAVLRRDTICAMEIQYELFGEKKYDRYKSKELNQILTKMPGAEYIGLTRLAYMKDGDLTWDPVYGPQRRFRLTEDFWNEVEGNKESNKESNNNVTTDSMLRNTT